MARPPPLPVILWLYIDTVDLVLVWPSHSGSESRGPNYWSDHAGHWEGLCARVCAGLVRILWKMIDGWILNTASWMYSVLHFIVTHTKSSEYIWSTFWKNTVLHHYSAVLPWTLFCYQKLVILGHISANIMDCKQVWLSHMLKVSQDSPNQWSPSRNLWYSITYRGNKYTLTLHLPGLQIMPVWLTQSMLLYVYNSENVSLLNSRASRTQVFNTLRWKLFRKWYVCGKVDLGH